MKILKLLLIVILTLISVVSLYYIVVLGVAGRLSNWVTVIIPIFFIFVVQRKNKFLWGMAVGVAMWAIVDIFYYGSYSATAPMMEFTRIITENVTVKWIDRTLEIFSTLFFPIVLVMLLLPSVRTKYFSHA